MGVGLNIHCRHEEERKSKRAFGEGSQLFICPRRCGRARAISETLNSAARVCGRIFFCNFNGPLCLT